MDKHLGNAKNLTLPVMFSSYKDKAKMCSPTDIAMESADASLDFLSSADADLRALCAFYE